MDIKERIIDAIESHLDWACEYNDGDLIADDLANTILQIFDRREDKNG